MELDTKKIGDYMQVCRKEAGLTQAELGEKLGVTPQSVSNWERGSPCQTPPCCRSWGKYCTAPWTPS